MRQEDLLRAAISEYESIIGQKDASRTAEVNSECVTRELRCRHDWTDAGARSVVALANDYGAFMLRNALAIAIALGKEDGDLGF